MLTPDYLTTTNQKNIHELILHPATPSLILKATGEVRPSEHQLPGLLTVNAPLPFTTINRCQVPLALLHAGERTQVWFSNRTVSLNQLIPSAVCRSWGRIQAVLTFGTLARVSDKPGSDYGSKPVRWSW